MDSIESRIEMLTYICSKVYETACVDIPILEKEFKDKDIRNVFYNFINQDISVFIDYLNNSESNKDFELKIESIVNMLENLIPN